MKKPGPRITLLLFALTSAAVFAQQSVTHTVIVNPDGSFSPGAFKSTMAIQSNGNCRTAPMLLFQSIRLDPSPSYVRLTNRTTRRTQMSSPARSRAASGIFTLGPDGPGLAIETLGMPDPIL